MKRLLQYTFLAAVLLAALGCGEPKVVTGTARVGTESRNLGAPPVPTPPR